MSGPGIVCNYSKRAIGHPCAIVDAAAKFMCADVCRSAAPVSSIVGENTADSGHPYHGQSRQARFAAAMMRCNR